MRCCSSRAELIVHGIQARLHACTAVTAAICYEPLQTLHLNRQGLSPQPVAGTLNFASRQNLAETSVYVCIAVDALR
jgi:hypothetical protein